MAEAPRLFVEDELALSDPVIFDPAQTNYLTRVMRLRTGDGVRLFNGRDGEWHAQLEVDGRRARAVLRRHTRAQYVPPQLCLVFAPLKKTRTDFLIEKATELGATELAPIMTAFTQTQRVKEERLRALVIEAAEQTERLDVPDIAPVQSLSNLLAGWPEARTLFYCDERGAARAMADELVAVGPGPAGVLVGPEGGFSETERQQLRALPFVRPVTLGPRILRAETAAVAALSVWQSGVGDWHDIPYLP